MPNFEIKSSSAFYTHKANESPGDCQDAGLISPEHKRYAVADGVTGSFFPTEWATLLVGHFCNDTGSVNRSLFKSKNWRDWLAPIQKEWRAQINEKVANKTTRDAFHLRNSLVEGVPAAAAFVGLEINIQDKTQPIWQAMILGDSCLFHLHGNQLNSYLLKKPGEFNYHPKHFASLMSRTKYEPEFVSGIFEKGDFFVLATDAIAKWILTRYESGGAIWRATREELFYIRTLDEFHDFVKEARCDKETPLEDDDVALITLSVVESKIKIKEQPRKPINVSASSLPIAESVPEISDEDVRNIIHSELRKVQPSQNPAARNKQQLSLSILALVIATLSFFFSFLSMLNKVNKAPVPHLTAKLTNGVSVYSIPKEKSETVFTVKKDCHASLIGIQISNDEMWSKVQFYLWISVPENKQRNKNKENDLANILLSADVDAYDFSSRDTTVIGSFLPRNINPDQIVDKRKAHNLVWYKVRIVGFILTK